jgi:hypothetical protein
VDEWHDFFLAAAGAAAVLAGLVFVGVSINLEMIMSDPSYGLAGRALEALVLLVGVLIVTLLLLVPSQGMVLAGAEVLAVGVVVWAAVVIIQLLALRNWRSSLDPACGAVPGGHATDRSRGGRRDGLGCRRTVLACSGGGSLVLSSGARCVGPTR